MTFPLQSHGKYAQTTHKFQSSCFPVQNKIDARNIPKNQHWICEENKGRNHPMSEFMNGKPNEWPWVERRREFFPKIFLFKMHVSNAMVRMYVGKTLSNVSMRNRLLYEHKCRNFVLCCVLKMEVLYVVCRFNTCRIKWDILHTIKKRQTLRISLSIYVFTFCVLSCSFVYCKLQTLFLFFNLLFFFLRFGLSAQCGQFYIPEYHRILLRIYMHAVSTFACVMFCLV